MLTSLPVDLRPISSKHTCARTHTPCTHARTHARTHAHTHRPSFCIHVACEGALITLRTHANHTQTNCKPIAPQDRLGETSLLVQMENVDATDAVDLTSVAVDLTMESDLDADTDARSNKRRADDGDAVEGETDSK